MGSGDFMPDIMDTRIPFDEGFYGQNPYLKTSGLEPALKDPQLSINTSPLTMKDYIDGFMRQYMPPKQPDYDINSDSNYKSAIGAINSQAKQYNDLYNQINGMRQEDVNGPLSAAIMNQRMIAANRANQGAGIGGYGDAYGNAGMAAASAMMGSDLANLNAQFQNNKLNALKGVIDSNRTPQNYMEAMNLALSQAQLKNQINSQNTQNAILAANGLGNFFANIAPKAIAAGTTIATGNPAPLATAVLGGGSPLRIDTNAFKPNQLTQPSMMSIKQPISYSLKSVGDSNPLSVSQMSGPSAIGQGRVKTTGRDFAYPRGY